MQENCANECLVLKVQNSGTELEHPKHLEHLEHLELLDLDFVSFFVQCLGLGFGGFDQRSGAYLARRGPETTSICELAVLTSHDI